MIQYLKLKYVSQNIFDHKVTRTNILFFKYEKIGVVFSWGCCTSAVFTREILLRIKIIEVLHLSPLLRLLVAQHKLEYALHSFTHTLEF